ncbi:V-type ATPase subunit [Garciella nitratireducens]|nr:V-type ATPase subunit [Garciella nitratireducens]
MMISNLKVSAVNTKVSAIKSNMLQEEHFMQMMNLENVEQVVEYLNQHTPFKDVLWDINEEEIHRQEIEKRLYVYRVSTIEKLIYYLAKEYKDFLKTYMLRYEIEDLKLVFKVVRGHIDPKTVEEHFIIASKYSHLSFQELLKQDSVKKVIEKLRGTKYYRLIVPYIDYAEFAEEKFNFYLEMILDKYYYHELIISAKDLFGKKDKKALELLQRNIDLYNLEWIYRATKYFDMSKEEILNFVLSDGYTYSYEKLKDCIYSLNVEKIQEYFKASPYEFLFNHEDKDIDLYMKRRIDRYLYYKALNLYRSSSLTFGKVISFLLLLEFETEDIISIIESKRYKMTASEISKYLIRTIEVK